VNDAGLIQGKQGHAVVDELDVLPMPDQAPPRSPIDDLIMGGLPPADLDPLADGILMQHQKDWIDDQSPLKLSRKGRRTGITFAEALDSTLIGAAAKSAGGDTTFYIGDTKDKGRAFVATCARFAKMVAKELLEVEEFLFEDTQLDGTTKDISAYRIRFASGFEVVGLSSNPANIRGLQGRVVIDEAAFHRNVAAVIDACNALLIWGGVIRIISTHNGNLNPFNELIRGIEAGDFDYSIHTVTFDDAVRNGLYERVCLMKGETPTPEGKAAWYRKVRRSYGNRIDAMREELDVIPREGDGVAITLAAIEKCSTPDYAVLRWTAPALDFTYWPEHLRRAEMQEWLNRHVLPVIQRYHDQALTWYVGGDFAMRQDRSAYPLGFVGQDLKRHVPLILEMRACPYDQQKQALFWMVEQTEMIGSFGAGELDANGNGMALAQETRQRFGDRIVERMPSVAWSRETGPSFCAAFGDGTILIPADIDVRNDLRQLVIAGGVVKMPTHVRSEGTDGGKRHGDAAVALWNFHAATKRGDGARWMPLNRSARAGVPSLDRDWIPA
jgi:phage FluMu gp28-like protein